MKTKYVLLLINVILLLSCNNLAKEEKEHEDSKTDLSMVVLTNEQSKNAGIEYGKIDKHLLSNDVRAKGRLMVPPNRIADVVTFCEGTVSKIHISIGEYVKKGQVLATIISPEYIQKQLDFLVAKNNLDLLENDFSRQQTLHNENVTSDKQYQAIKAKFMEAKSEYHALLIEIGLLNVSQDDLITGEIKKRMVLLSPLDGYVDEININLGKFIDSHETLFKIIDRSELYVELMIFEKNIMDIRKGQRIEFTLSGLKNIRYEAKITSISSKVEPDARTVRAIATFKNDNEYILPGMFVAAKIHTWEDQLDALPEEAILFDGVDRHFIYYTMPEWMDDNGAKYRKAFVKPGYIEEGYVQVSPLDDIPENARIVIKGAYYVHSEMFKSEE